MSKELQELKATLEKDKEKSLRRISEVQKEIQILVATRKEERAKWEQLDAELEGDVSERIQEVSEIQGRLLASEELIRTLESLNTN